MPTRLRDIASKVRRTAGKWLDDGYRPDEFTQRLLVSVAGMTERGNVAALEYAIQHMPEGAVVEIGIFAGQSTVLLDHLVRKHKRCAPVWSTDVWVYDGVDDSKPFASSAEKSTYLRCVAAREDLERGAYLAHIKSQFIANCRFYCKDRLPAAFDLASDDFFAAWDRADTRDDLFGQSRALGGDVALSYIDGDHGYAQARADLENSAKHMIRGSFVLLDDSYDGCWMGSAKVARETLEDPRFELVSARPNYLFRVR